MLTGLRGGWLGFSEGADKRSASLKADLARRRLVSKNACDEILVDDSPANRVFRGADCFVSCKLDADIRAGSANAAASCDYRFRHGPRLCGESHRGCVRLF